MIVFGVMMIFVLQGKVRRDAPRGAPVARRPVPQSGEGLLEAKSLFKRFGRKESMFELAGSLAPGQPRTLDRPGIVG